MRVGLFIPCYVDQFYPRAGVAAVRVLRALGGGDLSLDYPAAQTCCGQPLSNTGLNDDAAPLAARFVETFAGYDAVVCPSGSCTAMVRCHYADLLPPSDALADLSAKTYEFCEFLHDVLAVDPPAGRFPHRVGLHQGCHGLRELRLGSDSERVGPRFNKVRRLMENLGGIEFAELDRPDECCGFGGTFAVTEEAVSVLMGRDRLADHAAAGAEVLASADMSCLMHLEGLATRAAKAGGEFRPRVMHVAEVLAEGLGLTPAGGA